MDIIKGDLSFYQLNKISGSYIAELQYGGAYFPCCYELHIYFGLNAADIILARFDNKSRALKAQDHWEECWPMGLMNRLLILEILKIKEA